MTYAQLDDADLDDAQIAPGEYREPCHAKNCNRGQFRSYSGRIVGRCFACNGLGYHVRKTSPEARAKAKDQRANRKARDEAETIEFFAANHAEIWAWIESAAPSFEFAAKMREALLKFGSLTEGQLAACQRGIDARKANAAEREARAANAPAVSTDRLMAAFDRAKASGLKNPKLRFEGFTASLAKASSANAGAVYIKTNKPTRRSEDFGDYDDAGLYLGKIAGGKFHATRECRPEQAAAVAAAMADPLAAAVAYARRTGNCSVCGIALVDPKSVARGIGPVCAERFGL